MFNIIWNITLEKIRRSCLVPANWGRIQYCIRGAQYSKACLNVLSKTFLNKELKADKCLLPQRSQIITMFFTWTK